MLSGSRKSGCCSPSVWTLVKQKKKKKKKKRSNMVLVSEVTWSGKQCLWLCWAPQLPWISHLPLTPCFSEWGSLCSNSQPNQVKWESFFSCFLVICKVVPWSHIMKKKRRINSCGPRWGTVEKLIHFIIVFTLMLQKLQLSHVYCTSHNQFQQKYECILLKAVPLTLKHLDVV